MDEWTEGDEEEKEKESGRRKDPAKLAVAGAEVQGKGWSLSLHLEKYRLPHDKDRIYKKCKKKNL